MTNAEKNIRDIEKFLNQYSDGWVFIGFDPVSGEPMIATSVPDAKTGIALNGLAGGILNQGGVGPLQDQINESRKEQEEE